ncbi:50S ribosomal protein L24 [candidate division WWE3 bacterium CG08_land_8_20_14_0_20_43_13]|uniref:Large ribosomal subunit protein uL24 n=1 Tax=candidate division WWE3 bacterium CG08_land_8_20_14_0_20_43_13 TaxID=1975087 RepID=A0A2H0X7G1_UNCKA|nr:MAG: 50S ribosomal protein L24 [candidate division WWE3 bacterium CG08_land_8_20_14_0_20_43_13]
MKIRKGDKIKVLSGNWRSKEGVVSKSFPKRGRVLVEGVNLVKKHIKARGSSPGSIITVERALDVSKVAFVCPNCSKSARIGYGLKDGKKYRFCKKCKAAV